MLRKLFSSGIKDLSDEELIARYQRTGDQQLVGVLYQRYTHLAFGVCMKYFRDEDESQDAVIQIFEKLLEDLKRFEVENFKAWLYQVCRNHCLMYMRRSQAVIKKEKEYKNFVASDMELAELPHHLLEDEAEQRLSKLKEALAQLNEEQKRCVELFFIEDKSYQEIAEATGYSLNQVKSFLQNGKRNLKNLMGILLLGFILYHILP